MVGKMRTSKIAMNHNKILNGGPKSLGIGQCLQSMGLYYVIIGIGLLKC